MEEQKLVMKELRYLFSDEEKLVLSMELAKVNQEVNKIEEAKRTANAEFRQKIAETSERVNDIAMKISSGYEYREIECEVQYHTPKRNQKTLTRTDTGEVMIDLMTNDDLNLFNQYDRSDNMPEPEGDNLPFGDSPLKIVVDGESDVEVE